MNVCMMCGETFEGEEGCPCLTATPSPTSHHENILDGHVILSQDAASVCYKSDKVIVQLTPSQLYEIIKVLEYLNLQKAENLDFIDGNLSLYAQQEHLRGMRNQLVELLDFYVKHRPFSPFLTQWVDKIGKTNVRKMQDTGA